MLSSAEVEREKMNMSSTWGLEMEGVVVGGGLEVYRYNNRRDEQNLMRKERMLAACC